LQNEDFERLTQHSDQLAEQFTLSARMKLALHSVIQQNSIEEPDAY